MTGGREREVRLGDALAGLQDEADRLDEQRGNADDSSSAEALRHGANELDQQGAAVAALVDEYGSDATVTVCSLTAGEFGRVEDRVTAARQRHDRSAMQGYHRVVYAAAGLVDAPFFNRDEVSDPPWDERSATEQLDAKVATVADLDIATAKWLYRLVNAETTPDQGNGDWRER
jgi:hypothetical protein